MARMFEEEPIELLLLHESNVVLQGNHALDGKQTKNRCGRIKTTLILLLFVLVIGLTIYEFGKSIEFKIDVSQSRFT